MNWNLTPMQPATPSSYVCNPSLKRPPRQAAPATPPQEGNGSTAVLGIPSPPVEGNAAGGGWLPPLLYLDPHLIAVNKPAGLLAVPGRGVDKADCLSRRVQADYPDALVVHRLDQATSGVMLFARGLAVQQRLSRLFETRQVKKRYVAVVSGVLPLGMSTLIDLPLAADWPNRPRQHVDGVNGKPSQTRVRVIRVDASQGTSTLLCQPITGRTHQIRVHLAAMGHPILGDALYGVASSAPRLMLHAQAISLPHPMTGQWLRLNCLLPC